MRQGGVALVGLALLLSLAACRSRSRVYAARTPCVPAPSRALACLPAPARPRPLLEGTTWVGTGWRDSHFRIEFRPGGRLTWTTRGGGLVAGTWEDGTWRREGSRLVIQVNEGYATYTGRLEGDRIHGTIRNVDGDQGTWEVRRE